MSEKVAIMNVRKGCREMCGGKCTYKGKDLFNGDLCEEFEGFGGGVPEQIIKPPQEMDLLAKTVLRNRKFLTHFLNIFRIH